jgi:hypothetical protein
LHKNYPVQPKNKLTALRLLIATRVPGEIPKTLKLLEFGNW